MYRRGPQHVANIQIKTPFDVFQKTMASSGVPRLTDDRLAGTSRATEEVPEIRDQTNGDSPTGFFSLPSTETSWENVSPKKHQLIIDTKDGNTTHSWVHGSNIFLYLSMSFNADGDLNVSANRFEHENNSNTLTENLLSKNQELWNTCIKEKFSTSELFLSISGGFNHSLTHFLKATHFGVPVPVITLSLIGQNLCILFNGSGTLDSLTFPTKTTFVVPPHTDPLMIELKIKPSCLPVNFMGNPAFSVQQGVTPTTPTDSASAEPTLNSNGTSNSTQTNLFASTANNDKPSSNTNKDNVGRQHHLNKNSISCPDANAFKIPSGDSRTPSDVTLPHTRELPLDQDEEEDVDVVNVTPISSPVPSPDVSSVEEQAKPQKPQTNVQKGHQDAAGIAPQIEPAKKLNNPGNLTRNDPEQSPSPLHKNEDMAKDAAILVRPQIQKIGQEEPVKDTVNLEKMVVPSNLQQVKERVVKKEIAVIVQKRIDSQEEPERKVTAQKPFKPEKIAPQKTSLQHPSKVMAKKKLARSPDSDEESDEDVSCSSSRKRWSSSSSDSLYEKVKKRRRKSVTQSIGKPIRPRAAKGKPLVVDASSSEEDRHSEGDDEDRSTWCPAFNPNCLIGNRKTDDIWMECDTCHKWWHAFCIRLENKAYKNAFNCCHGEYLNRAQDSLNGTTKKKWLQIQKEQARKK